MTLRASWRLLLRMKLSLQSWSMSFLFCSMANMSEGRIMVVFFSSGLATFFLLERQLTLVCFTLKSSLWVEEVATSFFTESLSSCSYSSRESSRWELELAMLLRETKNWWMSSNFFRKGSCAEVLMVCMILNFKSGQLDFILLYYYITMFPPLQPGAYSVQQSQFNSPPVLYSQSQPMLVTNQNNMNYQMVNLGAGAMLQKMQQREQEERLIDLLTRQNELINELADDFNWRMQQRERERLEELEELEKKQILLKQKKAESEYVYKINRQLNHGLEKIKKQQLARIKYPGQPFQLGVKVPSIIRLEKLEEIYPNPKYAKEKIRFKDAEIQAQVQDYYQNPYAPYQQYEQDYYPPQIYQSPQVPVSKKASKESRRSASMNQQLKTETSQNPPSTMNDKSIKQQISQVSKGSQQSMRSQQSKQSNKSKQSKATSNAKLDPVKEDPQDENKNDNDADQEKKPSQGYDSNEDEEDYDDDG